jgi:hypothetical protein
VTHLATDLRLTGTSQPTGNHPTAPAGKSGSR